MKYTDRLAFYGKAVLSAIIILFVVFMAGYWGHLALSVWQGAAAVQERCVNMCSYAGIIWVYALAVFYIAVGIWVAVKPPEKLGFFLLAALWLLFMAVFVSEVVEYGQNPIHYPYPLEQAFYLRKIKTEILLAFWAFLGVLQVYLKGRKRIGFILFHSVSSIFFVLLNIKLFFPDF